MRHTLLYTTFLLLITNTTMGQNKVPQNSTLSLSIVPTELFNPWDGSAVRMALEYSLSKRLSVTLDGGSYLHHQPDFPDWSQKNNINGFIFRPMIKYYGQGGQFRRKHRKYIGEYEGQYIGMEFLYKRQTYDRDDSIATATTPAYDKIYRMSRNVTGLNFIWGDKIIYRSRIIFEYYVGAGVRYIHSTNNLSSIEENGLLTGENHGDIIGSVMRATGSYYAPGISIGLKIGYKLL